MTRRTTAFLYLLLVSIIWGAASPIVKHTLQWFDPWLFLTYRFAVSTLIAFPYFYFSKMKMPKKPADVGRVFLTGSITAPLTLFLFFSGLDKTTALSGSLISAVGPLFLIVGGALLFRDRITKIEKTGIGIALAGTILTVIGPLIMNGHADTLGKLEGNTLMLLATIMDITGALMAKDATKRNISPILLANAQFVIGFVVFLPLLFAVRPTEVIIQTLLEAPWQAHAGVLYMAILSGTIAYTLRNVAVKSIEVSESALFIYLQPMWAAILAVLWLRETVTSSYIIGGLIIAVGVIISEQRRRARPRLRGYRRQKHK